MNQNFTITEQEPETIGTIQNGRVQLDPNAVKPPQTPETAPPEEITPEPIKDTINAEMGQFKQEFNTKLDTLLAETKQKASEIFKSKDEMHKSEMETTTGKMSEDHKGEMEKTTTKMTARYEKDMAKKDKMIETLKGTLAEKTKELKALHKEVKDALYD